MKKICKKTVDLRLQVEIEIQNGASIEDIIPGLDLSFSCPDGVTARVLDVEQIG